MKDIAIYDERYQRYENGEIPFEELLDKEFVKETQIEKVQENEEQIDLNKNKNLGNE
jgi:hypothetical protein